MFINALHSRAFLQGERRATQTDLPPDWQPGNGYLALCECAPCKEARLKHLGHANPWKRSDDAGKR